MVVFCEMAKLRTMSELLENLKSHKAFAKKGHELPLQLLEIGEGASELAIEHVRALGFKSPIVVVSDNNTFQVLGDYIEKELRADKLDVVSIRLPGNYPKPDEASVAHVQKALEGAKACIAVGSGTINDICKYASAEAGVPYMVFGTAPSMNGYVSANASLIINGHRISKAAQMPVGVVLDTSILAEAPVRLIRSGIGDSLCRSTAQADWLFSHLLLKTSYSPFPFQLLAEDEDILLEDSGAIVAGDLEGIYALAKILILSGLGMWLCEGSYPASQGEHMIAHFMEMAFPEQSAKSFHGEQIAVTTLTMASLQQDILKSKAAPRYQPKADEAGLKALLGSEVAAESLALWRKKPVDEKVVEQVNKGLQKHWPAIKEELEDIVHPLEVLQKAMQKAGLATTPEGIGWQSGAYQKAVSFAACTRDRFTFLDVS